MDGVNNPIDGFELFIKREHDLVISTLIMKEFGGIRFLSTIKNINSNVNTMILAANPSEESEAESINTNIDYFFDRSKSIPIIIKYIDALMQKRKEEILSQELLLSENEGIIIRIQSHEVKKHGCIVSLTRREYQILKFLLKNKGVTLSRQDILNSVWGNPIEEIDERVIDLHIKNIRAKLKIESLMTIRGYGYKWNE